MFYTRSLSIILTISLLITPNMDYGYKNEHSGAEESMKYTEECSVSMNELGEVEDFLDMETEAYYGDVSVNETPESEFEWDGTEIVGYLGYDEKIIIPSKTTKIGDNAFYGNNEVEKVIFAGNSVKEIGKNAFMNSQIESIILPNSLTLIDEYAFYNTQLEAITIPEHVQKIGDFSFAGNNEKRNALFTKLKTITIEGNGLQKIGDYAFFCQGFSAIELPKSVSSIGKYAFAYCGLDTVVLPKGLKFLGRSSFYMASIDNLLFDCENVSTEGATDNAFMSAKLGNVEIGEHVKVIPRTLFFSTVFTNAPLIIIPSNVESIGDHSFSSINSNYSVKIESEKVDAIPDGCFSNSRIESISFSKSITSIGYSAFNKCDKLEIISLPENLYSIGQAAFQGCSRLDEIAIPKSCKSIGKDAFASCTELSKLWIPSSVQQLDDSFLSVDIDFVMYVVKNSYANYYAEKNSINYDFYDDGNSSLVAITYHLDGGQNDDNNRSGYYVGTSINLEPASKQGYSFAGWYFDSALSKEVPASFEVEKDIDVYAKWKLVTYQIFYTVGIGTNATNPEYYTFETNTIVLKDPTSAHGSFLGWYNLNEEKVLTIPKGSCGNVYLSARWLEDEYTVSFSNNGGSGYIDSVSLRFSEEWSITKNNFYKPGYYFAGWNTKANGRGQAFWDGETVSQLCSNKNGNITLYAQWSPATYQIVYELNEGTQNSKNKSSYTYNSSITLYSPKRVGYYFKGWYKDPSFSSVKVTSIPKKSEGDLHLYALWGENEYRIILIDNGSGVTKSINSMNASYSEGVYLPDEREFSRAGYTLMGWNTKANGSGKAYDIGEVVSELVSQNNGSIKLYAQWKAQEYTICYYNVDDNDNTGNPETYTTIQKIKLKTPKKKGYSFKGWFSNEEGVGKKTTLINKGTSGDLNFYAFWTENSYKLKFNKNNGKLLSDLPIQKQYTYTEDVTLPDEIVERKGYSLSGWNTKANGKGDHYELGDTVSGINAINGKTTTLYAEWTPIHYDVIYELNGGINHNDNPDFHTLVSDMKLKNPTKKGFTFKGWYTDPYFSSACKITKIKKSEEPVTVYAKWQVNTYTISFNKNGGSGSMAVIKADYDKYVTLSKNHYKKSGYRFVEWNTRADGTGTSYSDEEEVCGLISTNGGRITLYAFWEKEDEVDTTDYSDTITIQDDIVYVKKGEQVTVSGRWLISCDIQKNSKYVYNWANTQEYHKLTYNKNTDTTTHSGADPGKMKYTFSERGTYYITIKECAYTLETKILNGSKPGYEKTLTPNYETKVEIVCKVIVR